MTDTPKRILVVDDESSITEFVGYALKKEGYDADVVGNGEDALALAKKNQYDLFILDIMLPGMDGYELCRRLRSFTAAPVLFLSARDTELDKVVGLEIGADDYLAKPFGMMELVSRCNALLRRASRSEAPHDAIVSCGDITIDTDAHDVHVNGVQVELTLKEFSLLQTLIENRGHVLSRAQLLKEVWDTDYVGETRTVDTHVQTLRKKLNDVEKGAGDVIQTVRGVGYRARSDA